MNKKVIYLILSAVVLAAFYFGFMSYRNDTDRLLTKFNSQLKEEKFERIYDESSDSVQLNVTKEEFVRRMKVAVRKLKSIDNDLNFQTDKRIEQKIFGDEKTDNSLSFRRVQKLEKGGKDVTILVYWANEGISPKFDDFSVIASGENQDQYATPGVSYKSISNPEKY